MGAKQIDPALVRADYLLNLDNEMNHEVCIGTAGLAIIRTVFPTKRYETTRDDQYMFRVIGLR